MSKGLTLCHQNDFVCSVAKSLIADEASNSVVLKFLLDYLFVAATYEVHGVVQWIVMWQRLLCNPL